MLEYKSGLFVLTERLFIRLKTGIADLRMERKVKTNGNLISVRERKKKEGGIEERKRDFEKITREIEQDSER